MKECFDSELVILYKYLFIQGESTMEYGGNARLNGVTFHSTDVTVTAIRKNGKIIVEDDVDFEEYDYVDDDSFDINEFMERIPFIRGIWELFFKGFLKRWKSNLYFIVSFLALNLLLDETGWIDISSLTKDWTIFYIFFITLILILVLFIKFTPISKYHAAEHMVANCYDNSMKLTISNTRKQSRIHENCGTNLVIFTALIFATLLFFPYAEVWILFIKILVSYSLAYELFLIDNMKVKLLLKPIYLLGYSFQFLLVTSKPTDKHIEVAIKAFRRMERLQTKIDKM